MTPRSSDFGTPDIASSGPVLPTTGRRGFYGWKMVITGCVALSMTAPGQTAAIGAFIDPMITDLGISRSAVSTAYLIGTLVGAAAMPFVGRLLDRFGARITMALIGGGFGAVLLALAAVTEIVGLTAGFIGVRMLGQGALGLTATTVVALWFERRRGFAVGVVGAVGAAMISLAPVGLERLIAQVGWQTAWMIEGLVVWAVVIPLALFAVRNRPSDLGQLPDGAPVTDASVAAVDWGMTRGQAVRTPFFWVLTAAVATTGLLATGVAFHQIDLLGERGLSTAAAAANFIPQMVAGLVATLGVGYLVDRMRPRWLTVGSMLLLAASLAWGTLVQPGWSAIGFGVMIGAAGGSIRSVEGASFPRYFGVRHLGSIRGIVASVSVGSTAFGPILFALVRDGTGTYGPVLLVSAVIPIAVAVAALMIPPPTAHISASIALSPPRGS